MMSLTHTLPGALTAKVGLQQREKEKYVPEQNLVNL